MILPGRLRTTTLGDVFGVLHRERATGTLELVEDSGATSGRSHLVEFNGGLLATVVSTLPCTPIGEILRSQGFLPEDAAWRLARRLRERPSQRAGELLLEERLVTRDLLDAALRHQLRLRVDALFRLPDARLQFHVPRPRRASDGVTVPLSPREFLHGRERARARSTRSSARPSAGDPKRLQALGVLGLEAAADAAHVRRRFRSLAATMHPDRFPHASSSERAERMRRFAELSAAYHALIG